MNAQTGIEQACLVADDVSYAFGHRPVLTHVSLTLAPGELLGVVGPNGAGKSTLLKLIAGDLQPATGSVRLGARDLHSLSALEQARRRAVMPQASTLRFALTARQVVRLGRSPYARSHAERENALVAELALDLVDASPLAKRIYTTLSGGEQQRIQLARALAQILPVDRADARYLLLDEPTANLDLSFQQTALALARRVAAHNVGVLAVLHDLNLAALYCDRVVVLSRGRVAASGTSDEVFTSATIAMCFGVDVTVLRHPTLDRPLVVSMPMEMVTSSNANVLSER